MWRSLLLVLVACGKHAAPDCAHAGDGTRAFWDGKLAGAKTEIERSLARAMLDVGPARLVRHCKADGWSAEAAACGKTETERCLSLLSPAQHRALIEDPEAKALSSYEPLDLPLRCERDPLALVIARDGVRIGVTGGAACRRPREALERELKSVIARAEGCDVPIHVAAAGDLGYQELISAMDVAMKLGMTVSIDSDLAFSGDTAECPVPAARHDAAPSPPAFVEAAGDMQKIPVVIVTKDGLSYAGKLLADADELARALPPHPADRRLVLQADESTSTLLINRIVLACKRAGYDNLLFAVKSK